MKRWVVLAALLAASAVVAAAGGLFTQTAPGSWYAGLRLPAWQPPGWLFGPVWTVLYIVMAVAAWRVWDRGRRAGVPVGGALGLYFVQLALNLGWTLVFFGLEAPFLAFLEIVLLLAAIVATMLAFVRIDRLAGALFVPYVAWVTFAAALNFAIWRLNA
jgi:translocator protein